MIAQRDRWYADMDLDALPDYRAELAALEARNDANFARLRVRPYCRTCNATYLTHDPDQECCAEHQQTSAADLAADEGDRERAEIDLVALDSWLATADRDYDVTDEVPF